MRSEEYIQHECKILDHPYSDEVTSMAEHLERAATVGRYQMSALCAPQVGSTLRVAIIYSRTLDKLVRTANLIVTNTEGEIQTTRRRIAGFDNKRWVMQHAPLCEVCFFDIERREQIDYLRIEDIEEACLWQGMCHILDGKELTLEDADADTIKNARVKVSRNDPCICGSGMKFKKCCGRK